MDEYYANEDPWGYESHADDLKRKYEILSQVRYQYQRALDIGCGEGWITQDLCANQKYGLELSPVAASRCPESVTVITEPVGTYDLVIATGVLYKHYDYHRFLDIIKKHASETIITCNIESWEVPEVMNIGTQTFTKVFPYRNYTQRLRVFEALS